MIFACLIAGMESLAANVAGFAVGLLLSFTLNRYYVFGLKGTASRKEITRFLTVFAVAYAINVGVLLFSEKVMGLSSMAAQIPAIAAYCAVFFLLSQKFVFRHVEPE